VSVLIDTSAWIAFLRGDEASTTPALRIAIRAGEAATTDQVILELLAGARDDLDLQRLKRLVGALDFRPQDAPADAELAAELYRVCRRAGDTPRALADCLVGAVALRNDLPVLHQDRDFQVLARHGGVRLA
jgi:predicted nucleic acid-binding protein